MNTAMPICHSVNLTVITYVITSTHIFSLMKNWMNIVIELTKIWHIYVINFLLDDSWSHSLQYVSVALCPHILVKLFYRFRVVASYYYIISRLTKHYMKICVWYHLLARLCICLVKIGLLASSMMYNNTPLYQARFLMC